MTGGRATPGGRGRAGRIDVHAHEYPASYLDACRRSDSGLEHYVRDDGRLVVLQDGAVALAAPQPMPDLAARLAAMDAAGVEVQVLSVSAPSVFAMPEPLRVPLARELNDTLETTAASSGGRLRAFATLPLPSLDAALAELDRALALEHVVGVILCSTIARRPLDDERFAPLLAELSRRRTTVLVHPTTGCCTEGVRDFALSLSLDFLAETTNAIGRLVYSGAFERYDGIRWIFTHLGGTVPFVFHRFDNYAGQFPEARAHLTRPPSETIRGLYFDTVTTHVPALRCALDTVGAKRLVFGTDYPHVPGGLQAFVDTLERVGLAPDERALVERENAAPLIGLLPVV